MIDEALLTAKENLWHNLSNRNKFNKKKFLNNSDEISFGKRWDRYASWSLKNIDNFSNVEEAINLAQTRHGFELRESDNLHESISKWEKKVKEDFPHFSTYFDLFSEPAYLTNNTIVPYKGRLMSSMLCHLIRFHFAVLSYCSFPTIMCEIGGGYGAPARTWMTSPIFCPQIYIIIDLAESLFFSECFLRKEFLGHRNLGIINLAEHNKFPDLSKEKQWIILCPSEKINFLTKLDIDLIINTLSMQEMSEEWIDIYMKWLDQTKAKKFYSFNAAMTPINKMYEVTNVYSPRPSEQWIPRILNFPYAEGPAAEIVYDRIDNKSFRKCKIIEKYNEEVEFFFASANERESYLKLIEMLRILNSRDLNLNFVKLFFKVYDEKGSIPREVAYFCDLLLADKDIDKENRQQILEFKEKVNMLRKSGEFENYETYGEIYE